MFQLSKATTTLYQGSNVYSNIINLTTLCQNRGENTDVCTRVPVCVSLSVLWLFYLCDIILNLSSWRSVFWPYFCHYNLTTVFLLYSGSNYNTHWFKGGCVIGGDLWVYIKSLLMLTGREQADQVITLFIHIFSSTMDDDDEWGAFLQAAIKD